MNDSLVIGRVAGIPIGVNWSVLIALALIVWTLATGLLPTVDPGLSDATYVAMGAVAAVAYFGSILLHELGHALVARRQGVPISGITLWILGGVAKGETHFPSARAELRIALAGPAVSLALGALFTLTAWAASLPPAVDGVLAWLGFTNLALFAFNVIPALPLDGGRALHALLWRRWGFLRATRVAAGIGRAFGLLLIVGGLAMLILADAFSGAWFLLLGWFILWAAEAEAAAAEDPGALGAPVREPGFSPSVRAPARTARRRVDELMLAGPAVPVVDAGDDALAALRAMRELGADHALVRDDGRIVGVLTLDDPAPRGRSPGG
ncbi:MAG: hypothetical protein QOK40_3585 [Miltoncostaeaceae bacterium]|nr:hypothetical protein [Miltoncostaeaceae bacterium]